MEKATGQGTVFSVIIDHLFLVIDSVVRYL
jgi:hypothetical protein